MSEESLSGRINRRGEEDPHGYQQLGEQILIATEEIARELGGETFAKVVLRIAVTDFPLPSSEALQLLEMLRPGSGMEVMRKAAKVRDEEMRNERREYKKELVRTALRNLVNFKP